MQKNRKKEHKKVMKYIRSMNKNLLNDEYIGLNRFRIDLFQERWFHYSDGSGGELFCLLKVTDTKTGNYGVFEVNNYDYKSQIAKYVNDFLIRCSSGHYGHYPRLHYITYDVHKIIPYKEQNNMETEIEDGIIDNYSWLK